MLKDLGVKYVIIGHSRAPPVLRRDGLHRQQEGPRRARDAACTPSSAWARAWSSASWASPMELDRSADQVRARRRDRRQAAQAASSPMSPSGPSAPARPPPPSRRPRSAPSSARRSADLYGARIARCITIQYGGSMKPSNAAELLGAARYRRRPHRRCRSEGRQTSWRSSTPPIRTEPLSGRNEGCYEQNTDDADHYGRLRPDRARPGQRRLAGAARPCSISSLPSAPTRNSRPQWSGRGSARRPDGQQRGGPHQHRRRPRRVSGSAPHQPAPSTTARSSKIRPITRRWTTARQRGARLHLYGPALRRRRPLPHPSTSSPCCAWRSRSGADAGLHPRLSRRARRLPLLRQGLRRRSAPRECEKLGVGKIATVTRPLLRDGPRQALGARAEGL